jgi:hypothetical protein
MLSTGRKERGKSKYLPFVASRTGRIPFSARQIGWLLAGVIALLPYGSGCGRHAGASQPSVSLEQIYGLGDHPAFQDVVTLRGGIPLMNDPILDCPATEGGRYVFLFFPTKEVPDPPSGSAGKMRLAAVVRAASMDEFSREGGIYVWPKRVSGMRFNEFSMIGTRKGKSKRGGS